MGTSYSNQADEDDLRPEEFEELEEKTGFTREEIRKLYRRFKTLDRTACGTIGKDDLLRVPEFAMNPLVDRVVGYFGFGPEGDKLSPQREIKTRINFPDFVATLALFTKESLTRDEKLENAFPAFDLNADGKLSRDEFISLLQELVGKSMELQDIEELVGYALEDHPDGLTFEEFTQLVPEFDAPSPNHHTNSQLEAFHRKRERELKLKV